MEPGSYSPALCSDDLPEDDSQFLKRQKKERTLPAWSLLWAEWVAVVSSAVLQWKVGHQYVKRLTDTWQMSLSGCSLLCDAHLKNPVEASCLWVESHCEQPAPQVPCHPVLSWTMPPGWSLCCGRGVFCLFSRVFSVCMLPLISHAGWVWSWAWASSSVSHWS